MTDVRELNDTAVTIDALARLLADSKPGSLMAHRYLRRLLEESDRMLKLTRRYRLEAPCLAQSVLPRTVIPDPGPGTTAISIHVAASVPRSRIAKPAVGGLTAND